MKYFKIEDRAVEICGLTFIVNGTYCAGSPATYMDPQDYPEVEIDSVSVKGQPEADADSILDSIKLRLRVSGNEVRYESGYDLLETELLQMNHSQYY